MIGRRKLCSYRAHPDSGYGRQWRHRAIAVDKHGCLIFIGPERKEGVYAFPDPVDIRNGEGEDFEQLFGRFIK
jgi:hypothetical protein